MMKLNEILSADQTLREDEYLDPKTGRILCKNCHTDRRHRIMVDDIPYEVRILCACERARRQEEEDRRRRQEFQDQVDRNRSVGLPERHLRTYTFANDRGYNPEMAKAKAYVEHWDEMRQRGAGLLLWGDVGTGKTYMAGCIANALIDRGERVLMTNFARILNTLTGLYQGDRNEFIDSLNRYQLLIIDDLGMERDSDFAREQVFSVIDSRYRSHLPMIVTTNLTMEELRNPGNLMQARIFDRVLERCVPLCISRRNLRKEQAAENLEIVRSILEGGQ